MSRLSGIIDQKLARFLIVGVVNTLVGTAIMFGLYNLAHCSYWVSSAANYLLTSILSFFLNKYFTFQSSERSAGEIVRFALNIAACYLLAYGIAKPLCAHSCPACRGRAGQRLHVRGHVPVYRLQLPWERFLRSAGNKLAIRPVLCYLFYKGGPPRRAYRFHPEREPERPFSEKKRRVFCEKMFAFPDSGRVSVHGVNRSGVCRTGWGHHADRYPRLAVHAVPADHRHGNRQDVIGGDEFTVLLVPAGTVLTVDAPRGFCVSTYDATRGWITTFDLHINTLALETGKTVMCVQDNGGAYAGEQRTAFRAVEQGGSTTQPRTGHGNRYRLFRRKERRLLRGRSCLGC